MLRFILVLLLIGHSSVDAEDLNCLPVTKGAPDRDVSWFGQMQQSVRKHLETRREKVASLQAAAVIEAYQRSQREFMWQALGGKPPSHPLNAQLIGKLTGDGFTIEKILFESQPQHHVTANVYVPDGRGPFPAVVVSSGHSRTAKAAEYNQRFGILLAQHGMIACCFDPIGQGERSQMVDEQLRPLHQGTTTEHLLIGTGSILVGRNTATYRVWDAMRVVDYLSTRDDVILSKIGMTGCSGGGTLTSYVMALDDRIHCASPSCYITAFDQLIDSIGPQDAEQNLFGQLAQGLDQADYVLMRAPLPTLISSTSDDFFPIMGTWQAFREAKRIFTRLGASECVELVEADGKHGVQPENLAAIVSWMQRWLLNIDRPVKVPDFSSIPMHTVEELQCTPQGQVLGIPQERSVFDLNAEVARSFSAERSAKWQKLSLEGQQELVRQTLGIDLVQNNNSLPAESVGTIERESYSIEKWLLKGSYELPVLIFTPKSKTGEVLLYLTDEGKGATSESLGPIEAILRNGATVVTCDLRGQGETGRRHPGVAKPDPLLGDWQTASLAYLLGTSVVATRTQDILQVSGWLNEQEAYREKRIKLAAQGSTSIAALHAVFLKPQRFSELTMRDSPPLWSEIAGQPRHGRWITATVHRGLENYDLDYLNESLKGLIDIRSL